MKLSKRINYIILPIISTIFIIAGGVSYYSQKRIVLESLRTKLEYNADYIVSSFENHFDEIDSLTKQFLNNVNVTEYLNGSENDFEIYNAERQLIRFIGSISAASGKEMQLELVDMNNHTIFFYDSDNPFAKSSRDPYILKHFQQFKKQLLSGHSTTINPTTYQLQAISEDRMKLNVYRIFSPDQSIYDNVYSINSRVFVAKLSTEIDIQDTYSTNIQSVLGELAKVSVEPSASLVKSSMTHQLNFKMRTPAILEANSPYGMVIINIPDSELRRMLRPYLIAIISLVINVTLISFFLLKLLIRKQVLHPIETLTNQVAKAIDGDHDALIQLDSDDEVSSLNNNYIRLLEDINSLARRDSLTGLANRNVFSSALVRAIENAVHHSNRCALFFIDLDNFKDVNDTYGHHIGDELLIEFSNILSNCFRQSDIVVKPNVYSDVARIAGDEFAVILPNAPDTKAISSIAQRLLDTCQEGIVTEGIHHEIQVSIGIAVAPTDANNSEDLMRQADAAMYEVKRGSKNGYHFYSKDLELELTRFKLITDSLRVALNADQFKMVFMPTYNCENRCIDGVEVLIRSTNPVLKDSGPAEYIPIAESNGMIRWIDLWVINKAFEYLKNLIDDHNFTGIMSINISSWQLKNNQFAREVKKLLDKHRVPVSQIELEITETCLVNNDKQVVEQLKEIKSLGVKLALDDFGTGYTAFSQLQHYPVDTLKIDRSFIADLGSGGTLQRPLVDIIIELASLYSLEVIAEGIETQEQLDYVTHLGCQSAQGFYLSKPIHWEEFVQLIEQTNDQA